MSSISVKEKPSQDLAQEDNLDKNRHITVIENLVNNINKLELLEKRLSFALREVDLGINRG
jgi:hypothetical protein